MTATKKIELRKVSYSASLSEETSAYTAQVWVDGVHVANVGNHGQGSCDDQHPAKGKTQADLDALHAYIKANYPPKDTGMVLKGEPFIMDQDLESICGDLLAAHLLSKDLRRMLAGKIAFKKQDGHIYTVKKQKNVDDAKLIEAVKAKNGIDEVLNEIPFDRALEIYQTASA